MPKIRKFIVEKSAEKLRLDKYLASKMPEFSRSEIQHFNVLQNGSPVKFSYKVREKDKFSVVTQERKSDIAAENISHDFELEILYEDDDIIVVNKPRNVVMYPSAGNKTKTLVQNVLAHTNLSSLGGSIRPGVVHRLDKDTSGAVIFAKSDKAYHNLVKLFSSRNLTKKYVAFVWGIPNWKAADITGNMARSPRNRQKMRMVNRGGKPSHTEVFVLKSWKNENISKIRCNLLTGRTHQIRVHLSSHGFPILCDNTYGRNSNHFGEVKNPKLLGFLKGHKGQMLHAESLEFIHPTTNKKIYLEAPLPPDMKKLEDILK